MITRPVMELMSRGGPAHSATAHKSFAFIISALSTTTSRSPAEHATPNGIHPQSMMMQQHARVWVGGASREATASSSGN